MPDFSFAPVADPDVLAARWRALEAASDGGFFRGWTYLGTLLPHFAAPHLLAVTQDGRDLALGLFDRRRGRLFLHETGDPAWDRLYVEHNGLLLRPGAEPLLPQALAAALAHGTLALSGVDTLHAHAAAIAGQAENRKTHFAPAIRLDRLEGPYLDTLSANTRAQIRRAMRLLGPGLAMEAAATATQAQTWFEKMAVLHQQAWQARGQPGAFADPAIRNFHAALIATGFARGEIALLRVSAGVSAARRDIGYLYNFQHGGRVLSYQTGFAPEADPRAKTGLVSHVLAIDQARAAGARVYDFLAGAQRYKVSLAGEGGEALAWITLRKAGSLSARLQGLKRLLR